MRYALASCLLASCTVVADVGDDSKAGQNLGNGDDSSDPLVLETRVCASGTTTLGMDVSYYQETINWAKAKAGGIEYSFIRVSDGTTKHDPMFASNWTNSKAAGVIRGAYQFFRPSQDVNTQADIMINAISGDFGSGDLPPVIDVEVTGGMSPANDRVACPPMGRSCPQRTRRQSDHLHRLLLLARLRRKPDRLRQQSAVGRRVRLALPGHPASLERVDVLAIHRHGQRSRRAGRARHESLQWHAR